MSDDASARDTPVPAGRLPTPAELSELAKGRLPGLLGFTVTALGPTTVDAELEAVPEVLAPNGYLHAGTVVTLADTACGLGCRLSLPAGAVGFTTVELKANFLGTARSGMVRTHAWRVHGGRRTQIWDAEVHDASGRLIALFRCTQLVLWP